MPVLMGVENEELATRPSLLGRICDLDDAISWEEFFRLYHGPVFRFARKAGLSEADAEEVAADVFQNVAKNIAGFRSDPERGTFKSWLFRQARWRIDDQFRRLGRQPPRVEQRDQSDTRTGMMERLPANPPDDVLWDADWREQLMELALARIASEVPPKHFQAFQLYHAQGWKPLRIAKELKISPATVYVIRHRIKKLLKGKIERLQKDLG